MNVFEDLCYFDKRNPNHCIDDSDDTFIKPNPCYCDNCFYRRNDLARKIIELQEGKSK